MNSKQQGLIGIGRAIAYYTKQGAVVSLPLNDSQAYDIIVDDGTLKRVQVKTTMFKKNDVPIVELKTSGGNKSRTTAKPFVNTSCDELFVLVLPSYAEYVIPTAGLKNTCSLSLGGKHGATRVNPDPD